MRSTDDDVSPRAPLSAPPCSGERPVADAGEAQTAAILESALDCIVAMDHDGNVTAWNPAAERTFGYRRADAIGRPLAELIIPPAMRQAHRDGLTRFLATGEERVLGRRLSLQAVRADGSEFPAEVSISRVQGTVPPRFTGFIRDLTESKRAEEALRQTLQHNRRLEGEAAAAALRRSEERFGLLVENVTDHAIFLLDPKGRVTGWNRGAERIKGYRAEEIVGQPFSRFYPEEEAAAGKPERDLAQALSEGRFEEDTWRVRKDGSRFWANVTIAPLYENGALRGFAKITRDFTERRRGEQALRDANERLAAANADLARSNAELEQFAYVVSHDLQQPLRMVASFTELLSQRYGGKLDADADEFIGYAQGGARRMQRLLDDLLVYSRVTTKPRPPEPSDAEAVLADALANLGVVVQQTSAVVTWDPLPWVVVDRSQLLQVFQNLVDNALKFRRVEPPHVHVAARRDGAECLFSVRDDGIGFEPRHAARIFRVFQRLHTEQEYPGTGIGLATCKRIIERNQGRIWAESTPGAGSTFFFTLPAVEEAPS